MTPFVLVQLKWMTESTIHLTDSLGVFVLRVNGSGLAYTPWPDTKAWFPYDRPDRPDRPSRLKKCSDDRDDHMETLPRRSQTTRTTETTSIAWIEMSSIRTIGTIM